MKANELLDIIGEVADTHIQCAKQAKKRTRPRWVMYTGAIAACLILAIGCGLILPFFQSSRAEHAAPSQGGRAGHDEGSVFMSYAGPVFPLTLSEENANITATRAIQFDFSENADEDALEHGITVNDAYRLSNRSSEDVTVSAVYPVTGDLQTTIWPEIFLNGTSVAWDLAVGAYAGGFQGAGDENSTSLNLAPIQSWEGYEELLGDGSYFADAFTDSPPLDQAVTVYKFSNITDGGSDHNAATLCMRFQYDPAQTKILTWGFNGAGMGEGGQEYRDFFIREGLRRPDEEVKYFIAVGADIESYDLQGYQDGSCTPGEELESASATVTREEMTISELLRQISRLRYDAIINNEFDGDHNSYIHSRVSFEAYYQAVADYFAVYGPIGTDSKERYNYGMLDDIISESAYHTRILYAYFDVTIPANGSVDLTISQFKPASFDFFCSGSENVGVDGYDMVTSLGSNIGFLEQTASISNYDTIEIIRQNFGFDLAAGITEAILDPDVPHYYLEVREK